jgi:hypothetical protein
LKRKREKAYPCSKGERKGLFSLSRGEKRLDLALRSRHSKLLAESMRQARKGSSP